MSKERKPRFVRHGTRAYRKLYLECADIYLHIQDCDECGAPHLTAYCCWRCGWDGEKTIPSEADA